MRRRIILNQIKTPDGTILTSNHVHDYKAYKDRISNELYIVDGGRDYLKRSVNKIPYEECSIYSDDDFSKVREAFVWGTYGKSGKGKIKWVKLCDMTNAHILNILKSSVYYQNPYRNLFEEELEWRNTELNQ